MLLALAFYASTAHAGLPAGFAERPASSTRTRRTTAASCWGVKARLAHGENLPSAPSDSAPLRGRGQGLDAGRVYPPEHRSRARPPKLSREDCALHRQPSVYAERRGPARRAESGLQPENPWSQ
jgi:hypothetical protein